MNKANKILLLVTFLWLAQFLSLNPSLPSPTYSYGEAIVAEVLNEVIATSTGDSAVIEYRSLLIVGDVLLARNVESLIHKNDPTYPYAGIALQALAPYPAIVGNFEASMANPHTMTQENGMQFSVSEHVLAATSQNGFTHFSLANNHSEDFGNDGYQRTKEQLLNHGVEVFGQYKELSEGSVSYLNTTKGTIALIGISAVSNNPREDTIHELLKNVAQKSDWQIAYIHWGDEYMEIHNEAQAKLAQTLVEAGADLVVGHHPHVVQDIQIIDNVIVIYSLGNYIFDQYFSEAVQEGLLLSLALFEVPTLNLVPVTSINSLSQPRLMSQLERQQFLEKLANRSDLALHTYITSGYIPLGNFVASSSKTAIMVP